MAPRKERDDVLFASNVTVKGTLTADNFAGAGESTDALGVDLSSGNHVLTADEYADNFLFQPAANLAADRSITAPATAKHFFVTNPAGSLAFNLSIIIGSTTIVVTSGKTVAFHADGTTNGLVQLTDEPSETELSKDFSGGNVTLTVTEFQDNFLFQPDANLAASRVLTAPAVAKHFMATNPSGSGANTLTITIGTTDVILASGDTRMFHADGTANGLVAVTDDDTVAGTSNLNLYAIRGMIERAMLANNWLSVTWSPTNNLYASLSNGGVGDNAATSKNGLDWESRTSSADKNWQDVHWDETLGLFLGVATDSDNVATSSTDGITWTARTQNGANPLYSIASDGLLYVCTGSSGIVETTVDAVTWTVRTTPNTSNYLAVAYAPSLDLFCAVATSGTINAQIMTSPDGITWTARNGVEAAQWNCIAWSEDLTLFVAGATTGTNRIMTSPDGINWTARTQPFDGFFKNCIWSPEHQHFLMWSSSAVDSQAVIYSADGITWEVGNVTNSAGFLGSVYSPERNQLCAMSPTFASVTW